ncbi:MAG: DMT family transporter [Candidatus Melainabacteria bacterium]|nr:DMT family transporter [Candidatus Melainabacteria bacterium]
MTCQKLAEINEETLSSALQPSVSVSNETLSLFSESTQPKNLVSSEAETITTPGVVPPESVTKDLPAKPSKWVVYSMYAVCAIVWGTGWYAIRLSVSDGGYPIFGGAAIRYTLAALVLGMLIPFFPKAFGKVNRTETGWLIVAGILNAAAIALLYWGEKSISGGLASVLTATSPIMMAVIAFFTRTEKISANTIAGFCLSLAGVGIIFGERLTVSPDHLIAMMAILGAALFFALTNFVMKVKATTVKPLQSSVMFFASMSIIFWLAVPCEATTMQWPPPAAPTYALVYLAIACSALAFPAFFYVLRHSSLMFASTLAFVHPVIALITDCALEHEFMLTMSAYSGMSVVLVGVILSMVSNNKNISAKTERARA